MQRDDDQVGAEDDDHEHDFLQHDVAALLLLAQPEIVEPCRDHKARAEERGDGGVLPQLDIREQREARQGDRTQRHRDVVLDAGKFVGPSQITEERRGGDHHQTEGEGPDLARPEQLRLEAERDRREHDARKDQKAAVAF